MIKKGKGRGQKISLVLWLRLGIIWKITKVTWPTDQTGILTLANCFKLKIIP